MNKKLLILASLFITCLLISNIVAGKLIQVGNLVLPAAVLVFPITFLITDTINEVWGKEKAKEIIWLGFFMNIILIFFLQIVRILPSAPFWEHQQAYNIILGAVPRMVAASLVAYIVSQLYDVWAFDYIKKLTTGKHLWIRNNLSTFISQIIDSGIFITIAFIGTVPFPVLINMILSQYLAKLVFALVDTPFCYLSVNWAKKKEVEAYGR